MKKFLLKFACYLIPLPIYLSVIVIIDPFNYFKVSSWITDETKSVTSKKLNAQLWKLIEYKHKKTPIIILGDSRANNIMDFNVKRITGNEVYNFSYPGGTLVDMTETFWFADKITKLEEVYMGINFNLYNGFETNNNVAQAKTIMKNFISYSFSKTTFSTSIKNLQKQFFVKDLKIGQPNMNQEDFWRYVLTVTGQRFYQKYQHPDNYLSELKKIAGYCHSKGIKLVFFTPPNHVDWQRRINDFGLSEEYKTYLKEIGNITTLINMDVENEYTRDKNNFHDPMHPKNDSVLIQAIWHDKK